MNRVLVAFLAAAVLVTASARPAAASDADIHYAPAENLEHIDLGVLGRARTSIDFAAFVLTDHAIVDALKDARRRGVRVRIVLDGSQPNAFERLAEIGDVVRVKDTKPIMHMKSYVVDGAVLRTGSANFSASGLKKQDNDLVLSRDRDLIARFSERFAVIYDRASPLRR